jgi:hypothetical protein
MGKKWLRRFPVAEIAPRHGDKKTSGTSSITVRGGGRNPRAILRAAMEKPCAMSRLAVKQAAAYIPCGVSTLNKRP